MELGDHLVYIDITNYCTLDCGFCMYATNRDGEREDLLLTTDSARENISSYINHDKTALSVISGEGEPFNNEKTIVDILSLSTGGNNFQIVTNGSWFNGLAEKRLDKYMSLAAEKGDEYSLRLSIDSYHSEKMPFERYKKFFEIASKGNFGDSFSLCIRSVAEDKLFMKEFLNEVLSSNNISYKLVDEGPLDQSLLFANNSIPIVYKNLVNPIKKNEYSMIDYLNALEEKFQKPFTMGNMKSSCADKGLDFTVKPNGNVFYFGIEVEPIGNILHDNIPIESLEAEVNGNGLVNRLYALPFKNIVSELNSNPDIKKEIERINNPYWIVKELYPQFKEEFDLALRLSDKE